MNYEPLSTGCAEKGMMDTDASAMMRFIPGYAGKSHVTRPRIGGACPPSGGTGKGRTSPSALRTCRLIPGGMKKETRGNRL